ncbi:MAG: uracil-DNA glycosylase [Proteobacteria bacterium]|nr:uracil-DNA glycosylase [Pseudomonadota bacterium]
MTKPQIEESWLEVLQDEFEAVYMNNLRVFLRAQLRSNVRVYPPMKDLFSAFWKTPFFKVKTVILGQDPYHTPGCAHGLSFSVRKGVKIPPSLKNIYTELNSDLGISPPPHGELTSWAEQGVLLLNTVLTVQERRAGSHQGKGWERFTDRVIRELNSRRENLVFILWGSKAQAKRSMINENQHLVIASAHPSTYSADLGFFGSQPFSKTNTYLSNHGIKPIDWTIPA